MPISKKKKKDRKSRIDFTSDLTLTYYQDVSGRSVVDFQMVPSVFFCAVDRLKLLSVNIFLRLVGLSPILLSMASIPSQRHSSYGLHIPLADLIVPCNFFHSLFGLHSKPTSFATSAVLSFCGFTQSYLTQPCMLQLYTLKIHMSDPAWATI